LSDTQHLDSQLSQSKEKRELVQISTSCTSTSYAYFFPSACFGTTMVGSQAIIGVPALDSVDTYDLGGFSVDDVVPTGDDELVETSLVVSDGSTIMSVSAPIGRFGIEPGAEVSVIFAHGENGELKYHEPGNKGKGIVTFTNCSPSVVTDPPVVASAAPVASASASPSFAVTDSPSEPRVSSRQRNYPMPPSLFLQVLQ